MKSKSVLVLFATLCGLCAVTGCGTVDTSFPKPDTATLKEGTFPNLENLGKIEPGVTKNQIYDLLGPPHFHEWIVHVRVWNYLLNFRSAGRVVTCQYQIQFDDDSRVTRTRWEDPACEALGNGKTAAASITLPSAQAGIAKQQ